jgi:hypothetical protein
LTLRHWVNRLEAQRGKAIKASTETTYRTWRLYMSASTYGFESGRFNVNQSLLAKPVDGKSNLPLTRVDLCSYDARYYRCRKPDWIRHIGFVQIRDHPKTSVDFGPQTDRSRGFLILGLPRRIDTGLMFLAPKGW